MQWCPARTQTRELWSNHMSDVLPIVSLCHQTLLYSLKYTKHERTFCSFYYIYLSYVLKLHIHRVNRTVSELLTAVVRIERLVLWNDLVEHRLISGKTRHCCQQPAVTWCQNSNMFSLVHQTASAYPGVLQTAPRSPCSKCSTENLDGRI